jgi:hypothetical protein
MTGQGTALLRVRARWDSNLKFNAHPPHYQIIPSYAPHPSRLILEGGQILNKVNILSPTKLRLVERKTSSHYCGNPPDTPGDCVGFSGRWHARFGELHGQKLDVHLLGRRDSDCWSSLVGFWGDSQAGEANGPNEVGKGQVVSRRTFTDVGLWRIDWLYDGLMGVEE